MSTQLISILAALMIFASMAFVAVGMQRSRLRAATPEMEERLDRFGTMAEHQVESNDPGPTAVMSDRLERAVKGKSVGERTSAMLVGADLRMTVGEFLLVRCGAAVGGGLLGLMLGRANVALALLFAIAVGGIASLVPQMVVNRKANKRRDLFISQLGDGIGVMANSLRAGYSLLQTMEMVSRESPSPMADEFRRVVREVGLGISPQAALNNLLRRIPSEDLDLMVSAINIQHEIGGNLGQILDTIGETIRERVRIQGEIKVLTAQQDMSGKVIALLPVGLAVAMFAISPDYMMGMMVWPYICIPIGATILLVMGMLVMRKIVAIEV